MKRLLPLLLIVFLASGCGDEGSKQSKAERDAMNAEFTSIDFKISNFTMGPGSADQQGLERLTRQYAAAIRKYADDLGPTEVQRRLSGEAQQVGPWCPPCVEILRKEAEAE